MIQYSKTIIMILIEYDGKIVEGDSYAKIAWSSDLLRPQFIEVFPKIFAIGIDQDFAIYDFD